MIPALEKQVERRLRSSGGRMTNQRRLILKTLQSLSGHPTVEDIYHTARKSDASVNLSTVYRNIRWLEENELISPRQFQGERVQQRFDPASPEEHYHFRCRQCSAIIEFSDERIEEIRSHFEAQSGVQVSQVSLVLYGLCKHCRLA
ncbi:MAG TPA: Fur family transcriptional regulator [Levilinea sp.]|nr:Fur family transcriptional regulator [Levilinea sp.]